MSYPTYILCVIGIVLFLLAIFEVAVEWLDSRYVRKGPNDVH